MGKPTTLYLKKRYLMNTDFSVKKLTAKPTWSDEPLIEAVWETATEFGSVFWVPWAILDRAVTYILNWKMTEIIIIIFTNQRGHN